MQRIALISAAVLLLTACTALPELGVPNKASQGEQERVAARREPEAGGGEGRKEAGAATGAGEVSSAELQEIGLSAAIREKIETYGIEKERFLRYKALNLREQRLPEYRDDDEALLAKLIMLRYINTSRRENGKQPLELDILAGRVAEKMSREAAEHGFRGHWNLRGEKPYHRYALAGGTDHVSENASAMSSSGPLAGSLEAVLKYMQAAHDRFMAEKPPNDGHRRNILAKEHTHVGLGYAVNGGEFRYYEEYVDRYADIRVAERFLRPGEPTRLRFKPLDSSLHPYAVLVYYEPPLQRLSAAQINRRGSYPDFSRTYALKMWPWQLPEPDGEGFTAVDLSFDKPGSYYVDIYLSHEPYEQGSGARTQGKIRASGAVLFVE